MNLFGKKINDKNKKQNKHDLTGVLNCSACAQMLLYCSLLTADIFVVC